MTDADSAQANDSRDRSVGLIAFGVVLVVLAGVSALMGFLAPLALLLADPQVEQDAVNASGDWRSATSSLLSHLLVAALFGVLGVASIRRLRWAPPVTLSVAWIWLIAGSMALLSCTYMAPELRASMEAVIAEQNNTNQDIQAMIDTTLSIVMVAMFIFLAGFGVILPGLMVLFYRSQHVRATCEKHWPARQSWTDRCPTRLVGLSLSLAMLAGVLLASTPYAAVPAFGLVLTGIPAAAVMVLIVAMCVWLAISVARQQYAGWVGTAVLLVLLTIGPLVNAIIYSPAEQMQQIGMSNQAYDTLLTPELMTKTKVATIAGFVVIGLLTLGYMLNIRPDFKRNPSAASAQATDPTAES